MIKPTILPVNEAGDSRTGTINGLTTKQVEERIGFPPNLKGDPDKVKHEWGFTVNGMRCGVWDYKGSEDYNQFSTFGPLKALHLVFGENYVPDYPHAI